MTTSHDAQDIERQKQAWEMIAFHLGTVRQYMIKGYTEIMVNPDGTLWTDGPQGMVNTGHVLHPDARRSIVKTVASQVNKVCNATYPSVDGILPIVNFRFSGMIEPAVKAPCFTIRLEDHEFFSLERYYNEGTVSLEQAHLIQRAVMERKNFVVAGGTGSGKTKFSRAILELISQTGHRIMTIEDVPELNCTAANIVSVEVNEDLAFTYKSALHKALRFRPDRIVVGEIRTHAAAQGTLEAWNTGHNGGLTTIHSNSSEGTMTRIETLMENDHGRVPRRTIADAIDVIVYMERYTDKKTKIRKWRARDVAEVESRLDPETQDYHITHHYHPSLEDNP